MKTLKTALLALLLAAPAAAAKVQLGAGSSLWLEGDSTLHTFASTATALAVDLDVDRAAGQSLDAAIRGAKAAKMTVTVKVADLKSGESGLDKNLRKTLRADKFPEIVYALDSYTAMGDDGKAKVVAPGKLTIAGQTKAVSLNAAARPQGEGLIVDGEQPLLMTDFGVKPPSLMLGALKVKDKVVVKFHLVLEPTADEAKKGK